jgi:hypothetical protein
VWYFYLKEAQIKEFLVMGKMTLFMRLVARMANKQAPNTQISVNPKIVAVKWGR